MGDRRTVVVTGATSGIGLAVAAGVARAGCRVVIHGRSAERCRQAVRQIVARVPSASVDTVAADLALLSEVRAAA